MTALRLVLFNTFVVGFYFIPFHVLRIQGRSPQFIALTVTRSLATLVLRLLLVVVFKMGVMGVVLADVFVTLAFTLALVKWFAPLIRPVFAGPVLQEALSFGLPRVPHGVAHQAIAVADRYILAQFVTLREVGLYSIGASFGLAMKLFLSAFENAWAPFYFATMTEPDAKRTFRVVTTYGLAALVLLAAGLAAVADDVVRLMTKPEFYAAAAVVPWIGMGVLFQGVYLLTSIGLNITKQTAYYPVATLCAAFTSIAANLWLIPRFGAMGAAWANSLAYGVLAVTGMALSQRFYPVAYEWGRIMRVAVAGLGAFLASRLLLPSQMPPLLGFLSRGGMVLAVYPVLLFAMGFYQPREVAATVALFRGVRRGKPAPTEEASELAGEIVRDLDARRDRRPRRRLARACRFIDIGPRRHAVASLLFAAGWPTRPCATLPARAQSSRRRTTGERFASAPTHTTARHDPHRPGPRVRGRHAAVRQFRSGTGVPAVVHAGCPHRSPPPAGRAHPLRHARVRDRHRHQRRGCPGAGARPEGPGGAADRGPGRLARPRRPGRSSATRSAACWKGG